MWYLHASVSPYPTDYNRFKFSLSSNNYPIAVTSMSFKIAHNYYKVIGVSPQIIN